MQYAIRSKKTRQLYGFEYESNYGKDFCNDYTVTLSKSSSSERTAFWDSKEQALFAMSYNTQWYNSSETTPKWPTDSNDDFELVTYEKTVKIEALDVQPLPSVDTKIGFVFDLSKKVKEESSNYITFKKKRKYYGFSIKSSDSSEVDSLMLELTKYIGKTVVLNGRVMTIETVFTSKILNMYKFIMIYSLPV